MSNMLKSINKMVIPNVAEKYTAHRIIEGKITEQGRYTPEQTETFTVKGNFQPYNPRFVHSHITKEEFGDKTDYLKIFYPTNPKKYRLKLEDIVENNGNKWLVVGVPNFEQHDSLSYIMKLEGAYADKRIK